MSAATTTTLGQVVLSGDLAGYGESPELRATGVTPGTYSLAQMVIDAKGRTIFARNPTWKQMEPNIGIASYVAPGIFKIKQDAGLVITPTVGHCGTLDAVDAGKSVSTTVKQDVVTTTINQCGIEETSTSSVDVTSTTLGRFGIAKLGYGLVDSGGDISISVPNATTTTFGLIKYGTNIDADGDYTFRSDWLISSRFDYGYVRVQPTSSTSTRNALNIFSGVVSFNLIPSAGRYGIAKVNTDSNNFGVFLDSGTNTIHMFLAGNYGWGYLGNSFFASGSPLSIASDGTLSYAGMGSLPTASASVLGKIQVGSGLSVESDGTLSLTNLKPATTSSQGTVRPDNDTIVVDGSGVISAQLASATQLGVAMFDPASSWVTSNVTGHQTNGGWRPGRATNAGTKGVIINGNTSEIDMTNGIVTLNDVTVRKNQPNTFTGSQVTAAETVSAGYATYTPDFSTGNVKIVSIDHTSVTITNPVNVVDGSVIQMIIKKQNDSNTFSFGSAYKLNTTLNTSFTAAQALMLSCICLSSSVILVIQGDIITL